MVADTEASGPSRGLTRDSGKKSEWHAARGCYSHQNFPTYPHHREDRASYNRETRPLISCALHHSLARSMSQTVEKKAKKRKHAVADIGQEAEPSTKRHKKEKEKSKKKNKGKGRATEEFRIVRASMLISIPPVFANNLRAGAEEMLDSLLMRCAVLLFSESHPE